MSEKKMTRRKALKTAGAAALGGLAATMVKSRNVRAQADEPHELWLDEEIFIEMGSMFFRIPGGENNAPITLEAGKKYALYFFNLDDDVAHNALFGRDPDLENHNYKEWLLDGFFGVETHQGESGAEVFIQIPEDKKGEWEIGCFVTGHYEAGMKVPLIVV